MRAKPRAKKEDGPARPDWIITDAGLRRSDLPRDLRWLVDPLALHGPASATHGWAPFWRRE